MVLPVDSDFGSTRATLTSGTGGLFQVIWLLGELFMRWGNGCFSVHRWSGKGVVGVALGKGGGRVVGREEKRGGGAIAHCWWRAATTPASC